MKLYRLVYWKKNLLAKWTKEQMETILEFIKNNSSFNNIITKSLRILDYGTRGWRIGKRIMQFTKEWELVKIWDSWLDIQKELWIASSLISRCCTWKLRTTHKYKWQFWGK
jgi:hypothetical protein